MTKEELKQEAEEYATKRASKLYTRNMWDRYYQTYIDSAEPREKRIADLEKENAELKEELTKKADTNHSLVEQMADLESENAELKEQCSILADCNTCVSDCKTENIEIKTQLTKAKEIINGLLSFVDSLGNYSGGIFAKAEQFLSEVEK